MTSHKKKKLNLLTYLIIISTRSKFSVIMRPFQPAYLLLVWKFRRVKMKMVDELSIESAIWAAWSWAAIGGFPVSPAPSNLYRPWAWTLIYGQQQNNCMLTLCSYWYLHCLCIYQKQMMTIHSPKIFKPYVISYYCRCPWGALVHLVRDIKIFQGEIG